MRLRLILASSNGAGADAWEVEACPLGVDPRGGLRVAKTVVVCREENNGPMIRTLVISPAQQSPARRKDQQLYT